MVDAVAATLGALPSPASFEKRPRLMPFIIVAPIQKDTIKRVLVYIYRVVFDAAGSTLFCAGEIFKGGDGLLAAEVDNQ